MLMQTNELNADEKLKEYIRQRDKTIMDYESAIANAELRGRNEGFIDGESKGRAEGRAEGKAEVKAELIDEISANLREMGFTEEQIKQAFKPRN